MNFPDLRNGISIIVNACPGINYIKEASNLNFNLIKDPIYGGYQWTVSKLSHEAYCELKDKKIEIHIPTLETVIEQGKATLITDLNTHAITLEKAAKNGCELNIECVNLSYVGIAKTMFILFLNQYYILKAMVMPNPQAKITNSD